MAGINSYHTQILLEMNHVIPVPCHQKHINRVILNHNISWNNDGSRVVHITSDLWPFVRARDLLPDIMVVLEDCSVVFPCYILLFMLIDYFNNCARACSLDLPFKLELWNIDRLSSTQNEQRRRNISFARIKGSSREHEFIGLAYADCTAKRLHNKTANRSPGFWPGNSMITRSAKPPKAGAANHPETQRHTWSVGRENYAHTR
jgi:hypothetical protein